MINYVKNSKILDTRLLRFINELGILGGAMGWFMLTKHGTHKNLKQLIRRFVRCFAPIALASFAAGCAGPTTPLGAVYALHPSHLNQARLSRLASQVDFINSSNMIDLYPSKQILHSAFPFTFVIKEAASIDQIIVRHNGLDVTTAFLLQASIKKDKNHLMVRVPNVRLTPEKNHVIEIIYTKQNSIYLVKLASPNCDIFEEKGIKSTFPFKPDEKILKYIEFVSKKRGINSVLTAALVAQESGFNPKTVSWAKAIGLTQVSPLADEELKKMNDLDYSQFPRYPGLNELPYPWVQTLISAGKVNAENEWRLNVEKSLDGGLTYLKYIIGRWNEPENKELLDKIFSDESQDAKLRLVLASYNSGYSRVWIALNRYEYSWATSPELKEARRYVGRVYSFCEKFTNNKQQIFSEEEIWGYYHEKET